MISDYSQLISECYDMDSDGVLNITEVNSLVEGQLCGHNCYVKTTNQSTNPSTNPSTILSENDLGKLTVFFNKRFNLTMLYSSEGSYCNNDIYRNTVYSAGENILIIGITSTGHIVGGFRKRSCSG